MNQFDLVIVFFAIMGILVFIVFRYFALWYFGMSKREKQLDRIIELLGGRDND
jgi:ammonia channel protein AmtB